MSECSLAPDQPEDVEDMISTAGWYLTKAERLMRADSSFADTLPDRLQELAMEAETNADMTGNDEQRERLNLLTACLYSSASWLKEAADQAVDRESP